MYFLVTECKIYSKLFSMGSSVENPYNSISALPIHDHVQRPPAQSDVCSTHQPLMHTHTVILYTLILCKETGAELEFLD